MYGQLAFELEVSKFCSYCQVLFRFIDWRNTLGPMIGAARHVDTENEDRVFR